MPVSLKSSCHTNLGFPYHGEQAAAEQLENIRDFLRQDLGLEQIDSAGAAGLLEQKISTLLGTDDALWFPTGTLAQGIAARIHARQSDQDSILLHPTSHLLLHEENGIESAHGMNVRVKGEWREPVNSEDINRNDACVFVEIPQRHSGGKLPSWSELAAIKQRCAENKVALHMDGARLWSSRAYYEQRSYAEIASGFDSVYVSFYKDIGAMGGAALAGNKAFIEQARLWRTRLGGFSFGSWPMILDSLRLLDKRIKQMPEFIAKAKSLAASIEDLSGIEIEPGPPQVNLFHVRLEVSASRAEQARDDVARTEGIWLSDRFWEYESEDTCSMEIVVGDKALLLSEELFRSAVRSMLSHLRS